MKETDENMMLYKRFYEHPTSIYLQSDLQNRSVESELSQLNYKISWHIFSAIRIKRIKNKLTNQ